MKYFFYSLLIIISNNLYANNWNHKAIDLGLAHLKSQGIGIKVLVIDTGVDKSHPSISKNFVRGKNFVDEVSPSKLSYDYFDHNGHGTHVTSIITQVAPATKIFVAKACNQNKQCKLVDIIMAIEWGISQGVDLINMSLGWDTEKRSGELIYQRLQSLNIPIVAAAGNSANTETYWPGTLTYPAMYPETISVGALNSQLIKSDFSQYGAALDIYAPGEEILAAVPIGQGRLTKISVIKSEANTLIQSKLIEGSPINFRAIEAPYQYIGMGHENDFVTSELKNKICVISRGQTDFWKMAMLSNKHGAKAVIIIDNKKTGVSDGILDNGSKVISSLIPILMISKKDGLKLLQDNHATIQVSIEKTDYEQRSGTSFAAPHVTGIIALLKEINNDLIPMEIKTILQETSTSLSDNQKHNAKLINAYRAIELLLTKTNASTPGEYKL